jgi:hypothetical protein
MTRKYGKKLPYYPRKGFAGGGFVDSFGDPVMAHYNAEGGITEGEDPATIKHYPGRVSKIACWSEHSTFNRGDPTAAAESLRKRAGGYAKGGVVKKGKK